MPHLQYFTSDPECQTDPWEGVTICSRTFGQNRGRGWYSGDWGGAAESQSFQWNPVFPRTEVTWDGARIDYAIDKPLPDPGYCFNVNFATMEPGYSLMKGDFALGDNPITKYLTDTYGAGLNAAFNNSYRTPILSGIANKDFTVNLGPTFPNPGQPYDCVIGGAGYDFARMWNGKANVGSTRLINEIMKLPGASSDPILATYIEWYKKAESQATDQYKKMEKADTKAFWTKAIVAASLAFGGAAAIAALAEAASVGTIGFTEISKGVQLAYKAYNGFETLSADAPDRLPLVKPPLPAATIASQQAYVDKVTTTGLLQASYNDTKTALATAQADPELAKATLADARDTLAEAQRIAGETGQILPPDAVAQLTQAQAAVDRALNPPPVVVPQATFVSTATGEVTDADGSTESVVASILAALASGGGAADPAMLTPAEQDALAFEAESGQTVTSVVPWILAVIIGVVAVSKGKKKGRRK
jgi:hypothetical protein